MSDVRNFYVIPALSFLLHTAMRSSEQLVTERWEDVDWALRVLRLRVAKGRRRRVPLGPEAIAIQQALRQGVRERAEKATGETRERRTGQGKRGRFSAELRIPEEGVGHRLPGRGGRGCPDARPAAHGGDALCARVWVRCSPAWRHVVGRRQECSSGRKTCQV